MRKSPFSTPRGNSNGRPGFGWQSGGSPGRGYGRPKNFQFHNLNQSQNSSQNLSDDFIPFNSNTLQSGERKSGGNWSSPGNRSWLSPGRGKHRESSNSGFNNHGNNSWRDNNRGSPYSKDTRNSFRGKHKNFHRGNTQGNFDISRYMNVKSFLEDPWAELLQNFKANSTFDDSTNDERSDLSFNSTVLDVVRLNDSVDEENLTNTDPSSQEGNNDSFVESENSILPSSQESVENDTKISLETTTSQDSKD